MFHALHNGQNFFKSKLNYNKNEHISQVSWFVGLKPTRVYKHKNSLGRLGLHPRNVQLENVLTDPKPNARRNSIIGVTQLIS